MKRIYRYLIAAAIVLLIVANVYQYLLTERYRNVSQIQAVELSILNDSVAVYKSKNGELTYKLTSAVIDRENLLEALEVAGENIKILKQKDIEWRNITNMLRMRLEAAGSGEIAVVDTFFVYQTDTVLFGKFNWSNNYLFLKGTIKDEKLNFDYRYQTGIQIIQQAKKREQVVSVMLTDPNAAIISGNSITVKNPRKWWDRWWLFGVAGLTTGILIAK